VAHRNCGYRKFLRTADDTMIRLGTHDGSQALTNADRKSGFLAKTTCTLPDKSRVDEPPQRRWTLERPTEVAITLRYVVSSQRVEILDEGPHSSINPGDFWIAGINQIVLVRSMCAGPVPYSKVSSGKTEWFRSENVSRPGSS